MLTQLRIMRYAIIDEVEIELAPGFSVMTGETGAGKSILVDAMGLALGDRADASAVKAGAKRAEIGLAFELEPDHPARAWLAERGLDDEALCCLRRTIDAAGGSRAFINNRPATLKDLRALGSLLVDIHGQHEHQSLLTTSAQRQLLDAAGAHERLAADVAAAHADWQAARRELEARADRSAERDAELELLKFQLGEIEALAVMPEEPAELRAARERLKHVDRLQQAVGQAAERLYEAEAGSAHALVVEARRALEAVVAFDTGLVEIVERVLGAEIELKEAAGDLARRLDGLEADPKRLDEVEARLERIKQLARRHHVEEAEVPLLAERLGQAIEALDANAESLAVLERRARDAKRRYDGLALELSAARRKAAAALGAAVTARLKELGLPEAKFEAAVRAKPDMKRDSTGIDQIEFLVTTNPGQPLGPIGRIASGGELSRIGLALQVAATDASTIPTFVFDEVDAGIGGAVAEVVGRRLRQIAARRQVLCVTHLPQVASQGQHHYRIVKLSDGASSRTQVRTLDAAERIEELSRMLGGVEITAATRAHAEEMMRQAAT